MVDRALGEERKESNQRAEVALVRADLCRRKSSVMLDRKLSWTKQLLPADSGRSCQTLSAISVGSDLRLSPVDCAWPDLGSVSRSLLVVSFAT